MTFLAPYKFKNEWWIIKNKLEYVKGGKYHREDGPAIIFYNPDNTKFREEYYLDGKLHREDGPAIIDYYSNRKYKMCSYYKNDNIHKEDGPAVIMYDNFGKIFREEYYLNDKKHRADGPSVITYNKKGTERELWYVNGEVTNLNGPSGITYFDNEIQIKYCIFGKQYDRKQWNKKAFIYRLLINKCKKIKRNRLTSLLSNSALGEKNGKDICNYVSTFVH